MSGYFKGEDFIEITFGILDVISIPGAPGLIPAGMALDLFEAFVLNEAEEETEQVEALQEISNTLKTGLLKGEPEFSLLELLSHIPVQISISKEDSFSDIMFADKDEYFLV